MICLATGFLALKWHQVWVTSSGIGYKWKQKEVEYSITPSCLWHISPKGMSCPARPHCSLLGKHLSKFYDYISLPVMLLFWDYMLQGHSWLYGYHPDTLVLHLLAWTFRTSPDCRLTQHDLIFLQFWRLDICVLGWFSRRTLFSPWLVEDHILTPSSDCHCLLFLTPCPNFSFVWEHQ